MKRILYAVLLSAFVPAIVLAQAELQPAAIVKLTKTELITVAQVRAEVQRLEAQAKRSYTADERRTVLDIMINERLALQAAERDKIGVTDNEVSQQLEQLRGRMAASLKRQPSDAEFESAVTAETGLSLSEFKDQLRRQMTVQKYMLTKKRWMFDSVKYPTNEEIKAEYELNKAKFLRPETVRFSMIYIPIGPGADGRIKAKETATRIANEIGASGAKFDEMVLRGQASGADYKAGEGGYLPKTTESMRVVGAEFLDVAFRLKVGEVSRVLENPISFQIMKVTEYHSKKLLELGDLYQLGARATVADYLADRLLQERHEKTIDTATKEFVAELRNGNTFEIFERNLAW